MEQLRNELTKLKFTGMAQCALKQWKRPEAFMNSLLKTAWNYCYNQRKIKGKPIAIIDWLGMQPSDIMCINLNFYT